MKRTDFEIIGNHIVFRTKTKGNHFSLWISRLNMTNMNKGHFLQPSDKTTYQAETFHEISFDKLKLDYTDRHHVQFE